jgi:hypothetical protein
MAAVLLRWHATKQESVVGFKEDGGREGSNVGTPRSRGRRYAGGGGAVITFDMHRGEWITD